jgi:hypothetical protein
MARTARRIGEWERKPSNQKVLNHIYQSYHM